MIKKIKIKIWLRIFRIEKLQGKTIYEIPKYLLFIYFLLFGIYVFEFNQKHYAVSWDIIKTSFKEQWQEFIETQIFPVLRKHIAILDYLHRNDYYNKN